jgi:peptidoglycan/xylan/chitin deacetylase (PgdA/CDA1 family)
MKKTAVVTASIFVIGAVIFFGVVLRKSKKITAEQEGKPHLDWIDRVTGKDLFDADKRIWYKGVAEKPKVCLTIDDGPHPVSCLSLLKTLKEKKVTAAFYVIGKQVEGNPDLIRKMFADGHEIGNHTYSHIRLDGLTREKVYDEIRDCDRAVEKAAERKMLLFRPPGMRYNDTVLNVVRQLGHIMVHWTIGAKDFVGTVSDEELTPELRKLPKITPELIVYYVEKQLKPGAIILLHDNPVTAEAMPKLIDTVRARGYEFATTKEMMYELPQQVVINPNPPCGELVTHKDH